ncbi:MAG: glycosyltransferase family 4 protein, partial [Bacteriovoracaceae bacterium]|nr:glycosyltransferase family 4 protein [Bacteriovoracaceae bacterium]
MFKYATLFSPGPFGGAEKIVLEASKHIQGHLWLIKESRNPAPCEAFEKRCKELGVKYKTFQCNSQLDLKTIKLIRREIKKHNVGLVHSHGLKANFLNAFLPVKRVATQHGRTSHTLKMRIIEFIENLAIARMDALICVSKKMYNQESFRKKHLVENFISEMPEKMHYSTSGALRLLYVGRLSPEKNLAPLVQSVANNNEIHLTIAGIGSELPRLQSIAKGQENISFLGFQNDVSSLMLNHDALALPSLREGLPIVLIEAVTTGLPIFASNVGGIPDLVSTNGILFDPADNTAIHDKLIK